MFLRPLYFSHPVGARVAPQRCPVFRKGNYKIYEKTVFASFFNDKGLLCILENGNSNCR
jgi:hypothetical protein